MAHDVFISHSAKDKPIADAACARLEGEGIRCWIAPRDVMAGRDWSEAIMDGLSESKIMVVIISSNANASDQVKREVELAVNKKVIIIPLRIEDIELSKALRYFLGTPHWLDALTPPVENHLERLVATVKSFLDGGVGSAPQAARPPAPAPAPSPTPAPQPAPRNNVLIGAAAAVVVVAIGAAAFLMKPIPGDDGQGRRQRDEVVVKDNPTPDRSRSEDVVPKKEDTPEPKGPVAKDIVGTWRNESDIEGRVWKVTNAITADGHYTFSSTTNEGTAQILGNQYLISSPRGFKDGGTYAVTGVDSMVMNTIRGTGQFKKMRGLATAGAVIDPAMVGVWETTAVLEGRTWRMTFEFNANGSYRQTLVDTGAYAGGGGRFTMNSTAGFSDEGTYTTQPDGSLEVTGRYGQSTWKKSE